MRYIFTWPQNENKLLGVRVAGWQKVVKQRIAATSLPLPLVLVIVMVIMLSKEGQLEIIMLWVRRQTWHIWHIYIAI